MPDFTEDERDRIMRAFGEAPVVGGRIDPQAITATTVNARDVWVNRVFQNARETEVFFNEPPRPRNRNPDLEEMRKRQELMNRFTDLLMKDVESVLLTGPTEAEVQELVHKYREFGASVLTKKQFPYLYGSWEEFSSEYRQLRMESYSVPRCAIQGLDYIFGHNNGLRHRWEQGLVGQARVPGEELVRRVRLLGPLIASALDAIEYREPVTAEYLGSIGLPADVEAAKTLLEQATDEELLFAFNWKATEEKLKFWTEKALDSTDAFRTAVRWSLLDRM